jgi:predicted  nucleic acid-binding Zn-ribbon protein
MIDAPLRCTDCGAVWQSAPAAQVAAARGGCLRCGGRLVPDDEARAGDRDGRPGGDDPVDKAPPADSG